MLRKQGLRMSAKSGPKTLACLTKRPFKSSFHAQASPTTKAVISIVPDSSAASSAMSVSSLGTR